MKGSLSNGSGSLWRRSSLALCSLLVLCTLLVLVASGGVVATAMPTPKPKPMAASPAPAGTPSRQSATIHPQPPQRPARAPREAPAGDRSGGGGKGAAALPAPAAISGSFAEAVAALRDGRLETALRIRAGLKDPLAGRLLDWLIIRRNDPAVSSARIRAFIDAAPHWPIDAVVYRRLEQALDREKRPPDQVIAAFRGRQPASTTGAIVLARALLATGKRGRAAEIIRAAYTDPRAATGDVVRIVKEFPDLLRTRDHKLRMDRLLYDEKTSLALAVAKRLGGDHLKLARARIAVIKRSGKAGRALNSVPPRLRSDPGYVFSRIQYLRRSGKPRAAAKLLLSAPRKQASLVDPDEWWIERRLISRALLDRGDARTAYRLAAQHSALSARSRVEAEFHAGWYALRFLKEPRRAEPHFRRIVELSRRSRSLARGYYWLGRAAKARGKSAEARKAFRAAARYTTAYHGHLARVELGEGSLRLAGPPEPGVRSKREFRKDERVRAIALLRKVGYLGPASVLFRHLARTLKDDEQIVLLARLAERYGLHNMALQIGILAANRSERLAVLAFPVSAIPHGINISGVEKPLVYAIARQESAFNPRAISHAGARGLLQLMPGTARRTARNIGLGYSKARLTSDPAYNARLGAAHLDELVERFGGSYIMTFAGYNAGARRVDRWIEKFGDPRSRKVDPIDWIERIPFTETRNYVQKILENLQVYRARLGKTRLLIDRDLKRGR